MSLHPRIYLRCCIVLLCAALLWCCGGNPDSHPPKTKIIMGLNPSEKSDNVQRNARWLAEMISKRIGMPVEIFVAQDYSSLVEALRGRKVDFAFLAPVSYVFAERIADARVLLKAERNGRPFYYGCIVVNADSAYHNIADLKGKNIAWVDPTSASGHIFPKAALKEHGIDPETYFGKQTFAGGHDAVLLSVINGTVTCGATYANDTLGTEGSWKQLVAEELRSKIRPVFFSPPIPGDNLSTSQDMLDNYPDLVRKVTAAVQHVTDDSAGKAMMRQLYHVDGMVPAQSKDYDPVRRYADLLGLDITGKIKKGDAVKEQEDARNRTYSMIALIAAAVAGLGTLLRQTIRDRKKRVVATPTDTAQGTPVTQTSSPSQYVLSSVTVQYPTKEGKTFTALQAVNLTIASGEFIAVIGLSGAGKSTLLRCLNRMNEPKSGMVYFEGQDITHTRGVALSDVRKKIGFIFQQFNLVKNISVLSNTLSGRLAHTRGWRTMLGVFPKPDVEIAKKYLNEVGLADKVNERADKLSGGQQQRVAIARALTQQPSVILADEPMASLDPRLSEVVLQILRRFNREEKITVVVNLHVLDLAKKYADRIIALREGKIVFDGTPGELKEDIIAEVYTIEEGT